jgi:RHS repeat-associated protein
MAISSFMQWLVRSVHPTGRYQTRRRSRSCKPSLLAEILEQRELLTVFTWNTDSDGNWSNLSNWRDAGGDPGVPGSGDDVVISRAGANPTISVDVNSTINSLVSDELVVIDQRLHVNQTAEFAGGFVHNAAGNLEVVAAWTVGADSVWNGGTIEAGTAGGTIETGITLSMETGMFKRLIGVLNNEGTVVQQDSQGAGGGFGGGTVNNRGTGLWDIQSAADLSTYSTAFINEGTLRKSADTGDGNSVFTADFTAAPGSVVDVQIGRLTFNTGGNLQGGVFNTSANSVIEFGGSDRFYLDENASFSGSGAGRVEWNGARLQTQGAGEGVVNFPEENLHWLQGIWTGTLRNTGYVQVSGDTNVTYWATLTNEGTWTHSGSGDIVNTRFGTYEFVNAPGGIFEEQSPTAVLSNIRLVNAGTLRQSVSRPPQLIVVGGGVVMGGGTFDVLAGDLEINGNSGHAGATFDVAAGSTVTLNGNISEDVPAMLTGTGGGRVELRGTLSGARSTLNFPEGMFHWPGNGSGSYSTNIVNDGHITIDATAHRPEFLGSFVNNGTIVQAPGADFFFRHLTYANNYGTWEFQGDNRLELQDFQRGGLFNNFGTLRQTGGIGTSRLFSTNFGVDSWLNNEGLIEVLSGTLEIDTRVSQLSTNNGLLAGGDWSVGDFSTLKIIGSNDQLVPVTASNANVTLNGTSSSFPNIDGLQVNGGTLAISGGRTFTTPGDLTNGVTRTDPELLDIIRPEVSRMVGLAIDPSDGTLIYHPRNARLPGNIPLFRRHSRNGQTQLSEIPQPGSTVLVSGIDFTTAALNVGGIVVPAGSLLFINAEAAPPTLYALDAADGTVLATVDLPTVGTNQVGIAFHPGRGTVYVAGQNRIITEIDASDGTTLQSFNVRPSGSQFFSLTWGGLDVVGATGNLLIVGSNQTRVRELTATGDFVQDVEVGNQGTVDEIFSSISFDDSTGELWIAGENGTTYIFDGLPVVDKGELKIGAESKLTIDGDVSTQGTSQITVEVAGRPIDNPWGQLYVTGDAWLDGPIAITTPTGFGAVPGDSYSAIHYGSRSGGPPQFTGLAPIFEANVGASDVDLRVIAAPGTLDLTVDRNGFTLPASATTGTPFTFSYTVRNLSTNSSTANWIDSIYLSRDTTYSGDDRLIARHTRSGGIGSLGNYVETVTSDMPGIEDGDYHIVVVTDSRGDAADTERRNNSGGSSAVIGVATNPLTVGNPVSGTIKSGQDIYFRIDLEAGPNVDFDFVNSTSLQTEFFISRGRVPTRSDFDFVSGNTSLLQRALTLQQPQGGPWYILLHGTAAAGSGESFILGASLQTLDVVSATPAQAARGGHATLSIKGTAFTPETVVLLIDSSGQQQLPTDTRFTNSNNISATFDLKTTNTGLFDVRVTSGVSTVELTDSFRVWPEPSRQMAERPAFWAQISAPGNTRAGRTYTATITYQNTSQNDISAQMIGISSSSANIRLKRQGHFTSGELLLLAINHEGVAGVLPPGATGQIEVEYIPSGTTVFNVYHYKRRPTPPLPPVRARWSSGGTTTPLDLAALKVGMRGPFIPDAAWDAIWENFTAEIGTTTESLMRVLSDNASRLSELGVYEADASRLLQFELAQAGANGQITQRNTLGAMGYGMPDPTDFTALPQSDGSVIFRVAGFLRAFAKDGSRFVAAPGDPATLTQVGDSLHLLDGDGALSVFGPDGKISFIEDRQGNRRTASYTGDLLTSWTDSQGLSVSYEYNAAGRIVRSTDAAGRVTTIEYDTANEHALRLTDQNGTIAYEYISGAGPQTEHAVSRVTMQDGRATVFEYDAQGRVTGQQTTGQEEVTVSYDSAGGMIVGIGTSATYTVLRNAHMQTARFTDSDGNFTQYEYDSFARLNRVMESDGRTTTATYDDFNRLTSVTNAVGHTQEFAWEGPFTQLDAFRDASGNTFGFDRDAAGNATTVSYPDGLFVQQEFDQFGNATVIRQRDGEVTRQYFDDRNFLSRVEQADGSSIDYTWDVKGNLTSVTDATGTISIIHNARDMVASITYPNGQSLAYEYDSANRRTRMEYGDGYGFNYIHDSIGRLFQVTDENDSLVSQYEYDSVGRLTRALYGNGTASEYTFDDKSNLSTVLNRNADNSVRSQYDYTFDVFGRRTSMTTSAGLTTYEYDASGQLVSVVLPSSRAIAYSYDDAGNRIAVVDDGARTNYTTGGLNQLATAGNRTFTYFADGQIASVTDSSGTTTYKYNVNGQLAEIAQPGKTISYEYNALGHLAAVVDDGVRRVVLTDPTGGTNIVAEFNAAGSVTARYAYGMGLDAMVTAGGAALYYHADAIGDIRELTDATGAVVNDYSFLPFGETLSSSETVNNPFQYGGEYGGYQLGGGRVQLRNRSYDPLLGRFAELDPIELSGGDANLFRYVGNDPVNNVDPTGFYREAVATPPQGGTDKGQLSAPILRKLSDGRNFFEDALSRAVTGGLSGAGGATVLYGGGSMVGSMIPSTAPAAPGAISTFISSAGHKVSYELASRGVLQSTVNGFSTFGGTAATSGSAGGLTASVTTAGAMPVVLAAGVAAVGGTLIGTGLRQIPFVENSAYSFACAFVNPEVSDNFGPRAKDLIYREGLDKFTSRRLGSYDPNDIIGPEAFGPDSFIETQIFPYEIRFENLAAATAGAQEVFVTQQLDADLDWTTFALGEFGFSGMLIDVPSGRTFYNTQVELPAGANTGGFDVTVDVTAGINLQTGVVSWTFRALDPVTGDLVADALAGFLPPNTTSPQGEGFVRYSVTPKAGLTDGTRIDADATIVFDLNPPIDTPAIHHTIDDTQPISQVAALPSVSGTSFEVTWTGSDVNGSGIATYDVYVSADRGTWQLWMDDTTQTNGTFTGVAQSEYEFLSLATDNVGLEEIPPESADTSTLVSDGIFLTPVDNTTDVEPTFTWDAVAGAASYEVWVSNLSTGVNPFHIGMSSTNAYTPTSRLGIGRYRAWRRSFDSQGNASAWSTQYTFRINAPVQMAPMARYFPDATPTISWDVLPGATTYEMWIDNKTTGVSKFVYEAALTDTEWTATTDWDLGTYRIWVRGRDGGGTATWWRGFTEIIVKTPPTPVAPLNSTFDATPTFRWQPVANAQEYELNVRNRNTGQYVVRETGLNSTEFTTPSDLTAGPYDWSVIAVSATGIRSLWSDWTNVWIGGRTELTSPGTTTSDTTPTFAWLAVDGATRYDLWVDRVGGASQVIREQNLTGTQFTPISSLATGTYRVWVRAINGSTPSPWSISLTFSIV